VAFTRRNSEHPTFDHVVPNDHVAFDRWLTKVMSATTPYDPKRPEEVALRERLVIKIGANADPFPYMEKRANVTLGFLKSLHRYDYPTEIQTKNPAGIAAIADQFENPNWTIAVTLISTDEEFVKCCEPSAPPVQSRLNAIRELTSKGFKVMVKIQPCVYPKILQDLPSLVQTIKDVGCWAFNTEGLKIKVAMPKHEQEKIKLMEAYVGDDIRIFYKMNRNPEAKSDYELNNELRLQYTNMAIELASKHGLRYFTADNGLGCVGCGDECCGTEVLRDYKLWRYNSRSRAFDNTDKHCSALEDCFCNFVRGSDREGRPAILIKDHVEQCNFKPPVVEYEDFF
jgi:DNA repair photolyase